jgi:transposase
MGNDNRGRRYDDKFRAAAVALVIDKKLPVSRAAEQVGVAYETLRGWIEASGRQQEEATDRVISQRRACQPLALTQSLLT